MEEKEKNAPEEKLTSDQTIAFEELEFSEAANQEQQTESIAEEKVEQIENVEAAENAQEENLNQPEQLETNKAETQEEKNQETLPTKEETQSIQTPIKPVEKVKPKKPKGTITCIVCAALILLACLCPVAQMVDGVQTTTIGILVLFGENGLIASSLGFISSGLGDKASYISLIIDLSAYLLIGGAALSLIYGIISLITNKLAKFNKVILFVISLILAIGVLGPTLSLVMVIMLNVMISHAGLNEILELLKYGYYILLIWVVCGSIISTIYRKEIKKRKPKEK